MPEILIKGIPALVLAFAGAMALTWYLIPKIIKIVKKHHVSDKPGKRKIHTRSIPTSGGVAIFAGFTFGFLMFVDGYNPYISYIAVALMLLFFIGLMDDLIYINPKKKLLAEVAIALILAVFTDLHFTSLHGFLGISVIPVWASWLITVFIITLTLNAVNLIDGIDGLAASICMIASVVFGVWFWMAKDYGYAIMAAALFGSLLAYMRFNFSTGSRKIFMGDTGSLVIGFIVAVFAIRFNELNAAGKSIYALHSSPAVSIAILIVPLFDTLRVIILRLLDHKHPFIADNRHIHHLMLRSGFKHTGATLYISLFNIFIIMLAFFLDYLGTGILVLGFILLMICIGTTQLVVMKVKKKVRKDHQLKKPGIPIEIEKIILEETVMARRPSFEEGIAPIT